AQSLDRCSSRQANDQTAEPVAPLYASPFRRPLKRFHWPSRSWLIAQSQRPALIASPRWQQLFVLYRGRRWLLHQVLEATCSPVGTLPAGPSCPNRTPSSSALLGRSPECARRHGIDAPD